MLTKAKRGKEKETDREKEIETNFTKEKKHIDQIILLLFLLVTVMIILSTIQKLSQIVIEIKATVVKDL